MCPSICLPIKVSICLSVHPCILFIHPFIYSFSPWFHPINNSEKAVGWVHQKRWQLMRIFPPLLLSACPNFPSSTIPPSPVFSHNSSSSHWRVTGMKMRRLLGAGDGSKLLGDSLGPGTDESRSLKQSSGKPKEQADGQSDLSRVKSIKVHQIQNSCFLRVTNLRWKLRKTKREKCLWPLGDRLFLLSGEPGLEWDAFMMNYNSQPATLKKNRVKRLPKRPKMRGIQANIKINQIRAWSIGTMPVQNCYGSALFVSPNLLGMIDSTLTTGHAFTKTWEGNQKRRATQLSI